VERRGVVLAVDEDTATVLIEGGEIRRIRIGRGPVVPGQEIFVGDEPAWAWRVLASAAVLALLLLGGGLWTWSHTATPVATVVSVDINPSLDLGVSVAGQVVWATALDPAASRLLKTVPVTGATLDLAVADLTDAAARAGYLARADDVVVVAAGPAASGRRAPALAGTLTALKRRLLAELQAEPALRRTRVIVLPPVNAGEVVASRRAGLSLGRYVLARRAHVSPNRVRERPLVRLLTEAGVPLSGRPTGAPPGHGHGATGRGVPVRHGHGTGPGGKSRPGARNPQTGPVTITVAGRLTGVAGQTVVVNGKAYPVAPTAVLFTAGGTAPLNWTLIAADVGRPVVLTLANGQVIGIGVHGMPGHQHPKSPGAGHGRTGAAPGHHGQVGSGSGGHGHPHGASQTATVVGIVGGVGGDTVTVNGIVYPVLPGATWDAGPVPVPLTPSLLGSLVGERVRLTVTAQGVWAVAPVGGGQGQTPRGHGPGAGPGQGHGQGQEHARG
jgi:phage protein U